MQLTDIQKRVYANQVLSLERSEVAQVARTLEAARKDLLNQVLKGRVSGNTAMAILSNLESALSSLPDDLVESMNLDNLLQRGYDQGVSLIHEVGRDTENEEVLSAFTPILDLRIFAQEKVTAASQIKGVTQRLKDRITEEARISVALGEGTTQTMDRIMSMKQFKAPFREAKQGVERVARTVTNDLVNTGKVRAYSDFRDQFPELGIKHEWLNVTDFRTSDICQTLTGLIVEVGKPFEAFGWTGTHPPAHPNAYLPSTVVITPCPELLLRFWYEGLTYTIETEKGNVLPVTHDHPILTPRGFVPAADLTLDDSVYDFGEVEGCIDGAHHIEQAVPTIEDCFALESVPTPHGVVPTATVDLDSEIPDHKINIVGTYWHLGNKQDPLSGKPIKELPFMYASGTTGESLDAEARQCQPNTVFRGPFTISPSLVSKEGHSFALLNGLISIEEQLSLRGASHSLPALLQNALNNTLIPAQEPSDSTPRNSTYVEVNDRLPKSSGLLPVPVLSKITKITVSQYSGHVYHLQDSTAIQCAGGILAHNCRSTTIPVISEDPVDPTGPNPNPNPDPVVDPDPNPDPNPDPDPVVVPDPDPDPDDIEIDWEVLDDIDLTPEVEEDFIDSLKFPPARKSKSSHEIDELEDWMEDDIEILDINMPGSPEFWDKMHDINEKRGRNTLIDLVGADTVGFLEGIDDDPKVKEIVGKYEAYQRADNPTEEQYQAYSEVLSDYHDIKRRKMEELFKVVPALHKQHEVEVNYRLDDDTNMGVLNFSFGTGDNFDISVSPSVYNRGDFEMVKQAYAQAARLLGPSIRKGFPPWRRLVYTDDRAYSGMGEINIGRPRADVDALAVAYHELGHNFELANRYANFISKAHIKSKATSEETVSMNELTGSKSYGEDERALPDHYTVPYVGKIYEHGATEMFSVGIQMFSDPENLLDLYTNHRDHFYEVLQAVTHGSDNQTFLQVGASSMY